MIYFVFTLVSLLFYVLNHNFKIFWSLLVMILVSFITFIKLIMFSFTVTYCQVYPLHVDLVSLLMMIMSFYVVFLSIMSSFGHITKNINFYLWLMVFMLLALLLLFSCSLLIIFLVIFELLLIPIFIIISMWGSQYERITANYYFMLYTIISSFPFMVAVIYSLKQSISLFFIYKLMSVSFMDVYFYLFFFVMLAFFCKLPMYSVHLWLPKAHVEAPVSGSMVLAGVLIKMSSYSLFRFLSFYNIYFSLMLLVFIVFLVLSTLIPVMISARQIDMKSFIAYSSVSHMSLAVVGILSVSYFSLAGALMILFGHGVVSPAMFYGANLIYERMKTRSLLSFSGLEKNLNMIFFFFFFFLLVNMSFPPFINFFSELCVYFSVMGLSYWLMLFLGVMMIFTGLVMYLFYSKLFRMNKKQSMKNQLNMREKTSFFNMLVFLLLMSLMISNY